MALDPRSIPLLASALVCLALHGAEAAVIQGPVIHEGHTYYLLENATWTASEAEAIALGGHLVTTSDAAENAWVVDTFITVPSRNINLWLGFTDQVTEGIFVWTSGEPVTFTNWGAGEPNNFLVNDPVNGEDYGMLRPTGLWNDTDNQGRDQAPIHGVVELPFVIPEPSTALLTLSGLSLLAVARRARRLRAIRCISVFQIRRVGRLNSRLLCAVTGSRLRGADR